MFKQWDKTDICLRELMCHPSTIDLHVFNPPPGGT